MPRHLRTQELEEIRVCNEAPGDSGTLTPLSLPAFRVLEAAEQRPRVTVSVKTFVQTEQEAVAFSPENAKAAGGGQAREAQSNLTD